MCATPEQLHALVSYCLDFATVMLDEAGEFFPFGAVIGPDGKVKSVGGCAGNESLVPQEICRLLSDALIAGARDGSIIAAALASKVNIPQEYSPLPDGIRVLVESEGYSRYIYSPYRLAKQGLLQKAHRTELFEPFGVEISPVVFASSQSPADANPASK
jgi:hypothetical protein